ncbi:MAG: DUF4340 domain-containing protein [Polyangiaceae bacterium]|nr:DUF4340 domain-containing protein [Polyangiaceae bacterium]
MQTEKKIYIGLGILVLLGGMIYWRSTTPKDSAARSDTSASVSARPDFKIPGETAENVTKLVIKEKDKPEVVLEKRGEDWWVTKPLEAKASLSNVKSTIDNLKTIETKDSINDTPEAPAMYGDYELEGEKAIQVLAYVGEAGSEKVFDAYFGKTGSRGQMARLADKPGIWVVKGFSSYQYSRQIKDWREKSILKFEDQNVVSVSIENEDGKYSFSKNGDEWSGTRNKQKIARLDPEKIKDMLRAYKGLNAEDFADELKDKPDETGVGPKPSSVITIVLKDDAGTLRIVFGNTSSGSSRYAKKDGDENLFVIGSWAADWATAKVEKFQKPEGKEDDSDMRPPPGMPPMGMPGMMPMDHDDHDGHFH